MEKIDRAEAISKLKEMLWDEKELQSIIKTWDEKELQSIIKTLEELPEVKEYGKQVRAILDDFETCKFITVGCESCRAGAKIGKGNLTVCDVLTDYGQSIYRKITDILKN